MNSGARILIIDDDPELRDLLQRYLRQQNMVVDVLPHAQTLEQVLQASLPDLLVLDLMLPKEDGLSVCRRLRVRYPQLPVIMLTARTDEVDRIVGLEMGADDYLGKPFNPRELVARIQAVLRRRVPPSVTASSAVAELKESFGQWTFHLDSRRLVNANGEEQSLSAAESLLLSIFLKHPNTPLSRDQLLELTRNGTAESYDRSIDVQVHRLRRLIEVDSKRPRYLQTVWGQGYVFIPDSPAA